MTEPPPRAPTVEEVIDRMRQILANRDDDIVRFTIKDEIFHIWNAHGQHWSRDEIIYILKTLGLYGLGITK